MPDRIPKYMADRVSDRMPYRMSGHFSDRMPDRMSDRMPEKMPDRMPDRMSDRMSAKLRHQYGASYLAKTETNGFVSTLTLLSTNASLANFLLRPHRPHTRKGR